MSALSRVTIYKRGRLSRNLLAAAVLMVCLLGLLAFAVVKYRLWAFVYKADEVLNGFFAWPQDPRLVDEAGKTFMSTPSAQSYFTPGYVQGLATEGKIDARWAMLLEAIAVEGSRGKRLAVFHAYVLLGGNPTSPNKSILDNAAQNRDEATLNFYANMAEILGLPELDCKKRIICELQKLLMEIDEENGTVALTPEIILSLVKDGAPMKRVNDMNSKVSELGVILTWECFSREAYAAIEALLLDYMKETEQAFRSDVANSGYVDADFFRRNNCLDAMIANIFQELEKEVSRKSDEFILKRVERSMQERRRESNGALNFCKVLQELRSASPGSDNALAHNHILEILNVLFLLKIDLAGPLAVFLREEVQNIKDISVGIKLKTKSISAKAADGTVVMMSPEDIVIQNNQDRFASSA